MFCACDHGPGSPADPAPVVPLAETARPVPEAMAERISGTRVVSLHHGMSTVTGEELVPFTLAEPPGVREARAK